MSQRSNFTMVTGPAAACASLLLCGLVAAPAWPQQSSERSERDQRDERGSAARPDADGLERRVPPGLQPTRVIGGKPQDVRAVLGVSDDWVLCFKAGDIEGLMKLYTKDAVVMSPGKPRVAGNDSIRAALTPLLHAPDRAILAHVEEVSVEGRSAWASVLALISYRLPDGTRREYVSRTFLVYQRSSGGRWQILRDLDQPTPDAEPLKAWD